MSDKIYKICLVEDDDLIVEMYRLRLEEEGYQVVVCQSGGQVLDIVKVEQPTVIVLDIILPEVDGFSVLQDLKARIETKHIPVLVLSNLGQDSDIFKGTQRGAADYLVKAKTTPSQVVQKIRDLIHQTNIY